MKQQGAHPEGAESTSDASSRPDTDTGSDTDSESKATAASKDVDKGEGDCLDEVHIDEVEGDEPLLPARVHRPSDLMRLLVGVLAVAVVLAIAAFAHGTTSGLEQDI